MKKVVFLIALSIISIHPTFAQAADCTGVGIRAGDVFQNYELIDYALPAGATSGPKLLRIHFKINPAYNLAVAMGFGGTHTINDECGANTYSASPIKKFTLPAGSTLFSLRFASTTRYELWNDHTDTKLTCAGTGVGYAQSGCVGDIQDLPGYFSFRWSTYLRFNTGLESAYTSSYHTVLENPPPSPKLTDTLPTPPLCRASEFGQNTFFGHNYERARYVNGYLQVQYRIDPVNSSNAFKAFPIEAGSNCNFRLPTSSFFGPNVYFTEPVRYFSGRQRLCYRHTIPRGGSHFVACWL